LGVDLKSKLQLLREESERSKIATQEFFFWEVALCLAVLLKTWGREVTLKHVGKKKTETQIM